MKVPVLLKLVVVAVPVIVALSITGYRDYTKNCTAAAIAQLAARREAWEPPFVEEARCADYRFALEWPSTPDGKFVINGALVMFGVWCLTKWRKVYHYLTTMHLKETPLHKAATNGRTEEVVKLLKAGAKITALDRDLDTPLHKAALCGEMDILKLLLQQKEAADVLLSQNRNGWNCLHLAATIGHVEMANLLIVRGGEEMIMAVDIMQQVPLLMAAYQGHLEVVKLLVSRGGAKQMSVPNKSGVSPFHYACLGGQAAVVRYMLEQGGDELLTQRDSDQSSCMHKAVAKGNIEVVHALLAKKGREMVFYDDAGMCTPFHKACQFGHIEIVKMFLEVAGDEALEPQDASGFTCLHYAATEGHAHVCELLIERGGQPLILERDKAGITALDYAKAAGKKKAAGTIRAMSEGHNAASGPPPKMGKVLQSLGKMASF